MKGKITIERWCRLNEFSLFIENCTATTENIHTYTKQTIVRNSYCHFRDKKENEYDQRQKERNTFLTN